MDLSTRPEVNQLELIKNNFEYKWWEEPYRSPWIKDRGPEDEESLFRSLIDSMEKEALKKQKPNSPFRSTMEPRID